MELVLCLIPLEEGGGEAALFFINAPASLIRNREGGEEMGEKKKVRGRERSREYERVCE